MNLTPYLLLISERINAETGHRSRPASSRPTKPPPLWYCGYAAVKILIPTYYVGSNMGRQHTTWISDETWDRLQNIAGDSVSKKISNAVKFADPNEQMIQNAKMRQFATAKRTLRELAMLICTTEYGRKNATFDDIRDVLDEIDWIWNADMDVQQ